jgi:hypothetical protein
LLPFAFRLVLQGTARKNAWKKSDDGTQSRDDKKPLTFLNGGKGGFGAGIADADAVLQAGLPTLAQAEAERDRLLRLNPKNWIEVTWKGFRQLLRVPTRQPNGARALAATGTPEAEASEAAIAQTLADLLGGSVAEAESSPLLPELATLVGGSRPLHQGLTRAARSRELAAAAKKTAPPLVSLRRAFFNHPISAELKKQLEAAQETEKAELLKTGQTVSLETVMRAYKPAPPPVRRLTAYAFDPSLATRKKTADVNTVVVTIPFEKDLQAGPVGEYLEVIDVDPATGCAYAPVNLNDPYLLAQDGLVPSEGNPQFPPADGVRRGDEKLFRSSRVRSARPVFWAPLARGSPGAPTGNTPRNGSRDDNGGHGSRSVRSVRPAVADLPARPCARRTPTTAPRNVRCCSATSRPANGERRRLPRRAGFYLPFARHHRARNDARDPGRDARVLYRSRPNPDVYAFHEAFADIVALFAHFSYPEVLRHQIGETRGALDSENC